LNFNPDFNDIYFYFLTKIRKMRIIMLSEDLTARRKKGMAARVREQEQCYKKGTLLWKR